MSASSVYHPSGVLRGHERSVNALLLTPDGRTLFSAGEDCRICVYDAPQGQADAPCTELRGTLSSGEDDCGSVCALALNQTATVLFSAHGGEDGHVRCWALQTAERGEPPGACASSLACRAPVHVLLLCGTSLFAAGGGDFAIRRWEVGEVGSGRMRSPSAVLLQGHTDAVTALATAHSHSVLLSASRDGSVRCWEAATCFAVLQGSTHGAVNALCCDGDDFLLAGGDDGMLRVWRCPTAGEAAPPALRCFTAHQAPLLTIVCGAHARAFTGALDGSVRGWQHNAELGGQVTFDSGSGCLSSGAATALCLSPDGRTLVSAASDGFARCWDAHTGALLSELRGHVARIHCMALSPSADILYTGSADATVRAWSRGSAQLEDGERWERGCGEGLSAAMNALLHDFDQMELPSPGDAAELELAATAGAAALQTRLTEARAWALQQVDELAPGAGAAVAQPGAAMAAAAAQLGAMLMPGGGESDEDAHDGLLTHPPGPALTIGDLQDEERVWPEEQWLACGTRLPSPSPPTSPCKPATQSAASPGGGSASGSTLAGLSDTVSAFFAAAAAPMAASPRTPLARQRLQLGELSETRQLLGSPSSLDDLQGL